ncbi:DUF1990 domain-containing protein [Arthrobacter sp. H20]|uniref:DUF1990 family protein n=1 Tax=Arthrobacter sp. H20 TaxID=1267981 RepID=UPI00047D0458|nr:DUF1990 domain-containing protein [Arthrobacter sp. H20]
MTPNFTYEPVGLSQRGESLPGYRTVSRRARVGTGYTAYARLAEGILSWQLHRGAGLSVPAGQARAVVGSDVVPAFGVGRLRLPAPCRVVWTEEPVDNDHAGGAQRAGFGYGTLPGHPERGEEAFIAVLAPDGAVYFEVFAFSRHANWFFVLGAPVARFCQELVTRRYLATAQRLAR